MKRTQVYLPEELHEKVRQLSFDQRKSMAQVVRDAVARYVDDKRDSASLPLDDSLELSGSNSGELSGDLSGSEMEELKQNPLYHILGLVSGSHQGEQAGAESGQAARGSEGSSPCGSS